jgi:uncharacterized damage-inducible protein DinB
MPSGFQSHEAGLFVAQLDDQARRLTEDTRDLSPEELAWQPAQGMNTIGMLLTHIAMVEVYWIQIGLEVLPEFDSGRVLGIELGNYGLAMTETGTPPAALVGRDLAFFDDLLARARAHTRRHTVGLKETDLTRESSLTRRDGTLLSFTFRWVLYHFLEHQAGHYGQILLLRHLYRSALPRT